ncbi:MAG TPA: hypothetical protein VK420_14770, partial [Longimicrobium sp.]|nr:hypothetical protein [Longimicrobium sp.]
MIPIAPIVLITITVVRLLMKQGENGTAQSAPDPYARPKGWAMLTVFVLLPVTFACLSAAFAGVWVAVPFFLTGLALSFPWTTARRVAIPLGWPRVAATLGSLAGYGWGADRQGGTALAAAWALLRAHEPSGKDRQYVEAQIGDRAESLRGAGIVALGLLAAERGDLELARGLCRSVLYLDDKICPTR